MKKQLDTKDKAVINGWYEKAKEVRIDDGTLGKFFRELIDDYKHDYGTTCHAISAAAVAAAYAMAHEMRPTGFQFSCAELEFLKRTRFSRNKLGFSICNWDNILYPQYASDFSGLTVDAKTAEQIRLEAYRLLCEEAQHAATDVLVWWAKLDNGDFPEWLKVEKEGGEK